MLVPRRSAEPTRTVRDRILVEVADTSAADLADKQLTPAAALLELEAVQPWDHKRHRCAIPAPGLTPLMTHWMYLAAGWCRLRSPYGTGTRGVSAGHLGSSNAAPLVPHKLPVAQSHRYSIGPNIVTPYLIPVINRSDEGAAVLTPSSSEFSCNL
jgi:hypothetical protein